MIDMRPSLRRVRAVVDARGSLRGGEGLELPVTTMTGGAHLQAYCVRACEELGCAGGPVEGTVVEFAAYHFVAGSGYWAADDLLLHTSVRWNVAGLEQVDEPIYHLAYAKFNDSNIEDFAADWIDRGLRSSDGVGGHIGGGESPWAVSLILMDGSLIPLSELDPVTRAENMRLFRRMTVPSPRFKDAAIGYRTPGTDEASGEIAVATVHDILPGVCEAYEILAMLKAGSGEGHEYIPSLTVLDDVARFLEQLP